MADLTALALNAVDTLSVSEIHGVVCGLAIWQEENFHLQELIDLVGVDALTDEFSVEAFVNASVEALTAEDMSFSPLLPEEDAELELRVESIAEWCAGFLAGFGAAGTARGLSSLDALPDEAQEILGDLSAITEIDAQAYADPDEEDAEEAEADLVQIQEFVKVGVLLILSLITEPPEDRTPEQSPDQPLHDRGQ
jgi:uncharacterized protein YgfB (UPF0149 family)